MASQDPFDNVLKALGLYKDIQNIVPAMIGPQGGAQQYSSRIKVTDTAGNAATIQQAPSPVRISWALKLIKFIHPTPDATSEIRPMNLKLILDGTVQVTLALVYSTRYHIPRSTVKDLPLQERVWRAEKFALGILLYEIFTGHKPFEELADDEVQDKYSQADFPRDLGSVQPLCLQSLIYACWSAEFGRYITLNRFQRYVRDNPKMFALQTAGAVIVLATLIAMPILGVVGSSTLGPVVGSADVALQSLIGTVEAGGLFVSCQSAAIGGAAASELVITGATGLVITGGAGIEITGGAGMVITSAAGLEITSAAGLGITGAAGLGITGAAGLGITGAAGLGITGAAIGAAALASVSPAAERLRIIFVRGFRKAA